MAVGRSGVEAQKRAAAGAAAELVEDGMVLGLGTGSTVAYLLTAVAARGLRLTCVATSPRTARAARALGLRVRDFRTVARLDLAIDGADQVDDAGWLVKGGGGAHLREKMVAAAADRFVVVASSDKLVGAVSAPVPVELFGFGLAATLAELPELSLRAAPRTPDRGVLADYRGPVGDPARLAARLESVPGVAGHGLFPPAMVAEVLVGTDAGVRSRPDHR